MRREPDGLVIEASILARLLRIRLLRLDATVVVVPADVAERAPPVVDGRSRVPPVRSLLFPAPAPNGRRPGLADAVRTIEEGAAILAEARRIAPTRRRGRVGPPT